MGANVTGRTTLTVIAAAGTGLLVAACASGSSSSSSSAASTAPASTAPASTAPASAAATSGTGNAAGTALRTEHASMGTVLADGQGYTVYWFSADHGGTSNCTGSCAAAWPPVTGTPSAASGVSLPGRLGTIARAGGQRQATYNGHPLYTFKVDTAPGQASGNGVTAFGGTWYAITIGSGSGTGVSASPSPTGYGY